jgi:hypothetical protein
VLRCLNVDARFARSRAAAVVAFKAQCKDDGSSQEPAVGRPVRIVACLAALDNGWCMLINEGSAPVAMAFHAGFVVERGLFHHRRTCRPPPRSGKRTVRIMTIPAIHEALVDAMLGGHFELRAYAVMARKTRLATSLRQQEFRARRMMDRVAVGTDHVIHGVFRALDVRLLEVLRMAREASVQDLLGLHQGERVLDGGLATLRSDVILPRTVTTLAPGLLGRTVARGHRLVVRILIEARPYVGVTGLTGGAAHETVGWRLSLCRRHDSCETQNREQSGATCQTYNRRMRSPFMAGSSPSEHTQMITSNGGR